MCRGREGTPESVTCALYLPELPLAHISAPRRRHGQYRLGGASAKPPARSSPVGSTPCCGPQHALRGPRDPQLPACLVRASRRHLQAQRGARSWLEPGRRLRRGGVGAPFRGAVLARIRGVRAGPSPLGLNRGRSGRWATVLRVRMGGWDPCQHPSF